MPPFRPTTATILGRTRECARLCTEHAADVLFRHLRAWYCASPWQPSVMARQCGAVGPVATTIVGSTTSRGSEMLPGRSSRHSRAECAPRPADGTRQRFGDSRDAHRKRTVRPGLGRGGSPRSSDGRCRAEPALDFGLRVRRYTFSACSNDCRTKSSHERAEPLLARRRRPPATRARRSSPLVISRGGTRRAVEKRVERQLDQHAVRQALDRELHPEIPPLRYPGASPLYRRPGSVVAPPPIAWSRLREALFTKLLRVTKLLRAHREMARQVLLHPPVIDS